MSASVITRAIKSALWPNQWRWLQAANSHPYIAHLGARQIGKDRTWSALPAFRSLLRKDLWNCFSATQRHAIQLLREVKNWLKYLIAVCRNAGLNPPDILKPESKQHVELTNGSLIFSHPATLRAAVGNRGSALLNEAGQIPHAQKLFEGILPFVMASLELGQPANMAVISNASHQGSWLHSFWTSPPGWAGASSRTFYRIKTTLASHLKSRGWNTRAIEKAIRARIAAMGEPAYQQWYNCDWRSLQGRYLSDAVLSTASAGYESRLSSVRANLLGHTLGYDPGRAQDPAAIDKVLIGTDNKRAALAPWWSPQGGVAYAAQYAQLEHESRSDGYCWGLAADGTGSQCAIVERVEEVLPHVPVYGLSFGNASIWRIMGALKDACETGLIKIPNHPRLHTELKQIVYGRTNTGLPRLEWPRFKDEDGHRSHGDGAVALALANWVIDECGAIA